ncbi:9755_t:CDS:2 [Dentiscutata heterogama]|uniref:9755_t:CDS:1 n=1 Tax=Dentiscutata heterogama TaxID=1316150 RepID=A0ACA9L2Q3_9GLOM|nr:9755_t:CDS:2 [Dentiscutata heterogama]
MSEKHSNNSNSIKSSNKKKKALSGDKKRTKIKKNDDNTNCNTSYVYTSRSTGNAIMHLQNAHEKPNIEKLKFNNKQDVSNIKKYSEAWQIQLRQLLTTWIIKDSQAINVLKN